MEPQPKPTSCGFDDMQKKTIHYIFISSILAVTIHAGEVEHKEAAHDLIKVLGSKDIFLESMFQGLEEVEANWRESGVPDHLIPSARSAYQDWITEDMNWEEMKPLIANEYMKRFSASELKELTSFLRTPLGHKFLHYEDKLRTESMAIGREYVRSKRPLLKPRLLKVLEAENTNK